MNTQIPQLENEKIIVDSELILIYMELTGCNIQTALMAFDYGMKEVN